MRKFYLLIVIIITILIFGFFSFYYFKANLLPKILEKNYRINTTYNDLRDEILEIRKIHLELGYIKTNLDKKMNFKKLSLENLVPYKKNYVGQYINRINQDSNGKVSNTGVIMYGLLLATIFAVLKFLLIP